MDVNVLEGQVITSVRKESDLVFNGDVYLTLVFADGRQAIFYHRWECSEKIWLDDVVGDWGDIIGEKVVAAYMTTSEMEDVEELGTWTFYTIATFKGAVTLRFCGESNGNYSETVDFAIEERPGQWEADGPTF